MFYLVSKKSLKIRLTIELKGDILINVAAKRSKKTSLKDIKKKLTQNLLSVILIKSLLRERQTNDL